MTFNPDEKRDAAGRWTAGGEAAVEKQDRDTLPQDIARYAKAATNVAVDLGFDPTKITVTDTEKKFELNGKMYDYAGAAYTRGGGDGHEKGDIVLFEKHLSPSSVFEVTAHEIGHQKFQKFLDDYRAQSDAVMKEPGPPPNPNAESYPQRRGGSFAVMSADGMLREPYASEYPLYTKYHELVDKVGIDQLAKSDGITDYSKEWWKAWKDGKAQTDQAFHETIAEMTAREYTKAVDYESESPKFKDAGFALDVTHGAYLRPAEYRVRVWKGEAADENTLPPELKASLGKLRDRAEYEARLLSPSTATTKYSDPAPEWVALYDAVKEHWKKS